MKLRSHIAGNAIMLSRDNWNGMGGDRFVGSCDRLCTRQSNEAIGFQRGWGLRVVSRNCGAISQSIASCWSLALVGGDREQS